MEKFKEGQAAKPLHETTRQDLSIDSRRSVDPSIQNILFSILSRWNM